MNFSRWLTKKLTTGDIIDFFKKYRTKKRTLVIKCQDAPFQDYFPNRVRISDQKVKDVDVVCKSYYRLPFEDNEFEVVTCTGLLEHLDDPDKFLKEVHRVTKKGGQVLISCSSVFSYHEYPDNYYHFTPQGLKTSLERSGFKKAKTWGSCSTMKTIAILVQRVAFQIKAPKVFRLCLFLIAKVIPKLQWFIREEYGDISHDHRIDSLMASNIQGVAKK